MNPTTHPPDLEDLAAYIDGRLDAARRAAVEERLAGDEGYYEVFLETVRTQRELEAIGNTGAKVVALRPRRWPWLGAVAAAAALAMAVGLGVFETTDPLALLDAPAVVANKAWNAPDGSVSRSSDGVPSDALAAFQLGTHGVHLRIALEAEKVDDARRAAGEIGALAKLLRLRAEARQADTLSASLEGGKVPKGGPASARELMEQIADSLARRPAGQPGSLPLATHYALGHWTKLGQLAAWSKNAEVLTLVLDRRDQWAAPSAFGDEDRDRLGQLAKKLHQTPGALGTEEWTEAKELFEKLRKDITR